MDEWEQLNTEDGEWWMELHMPKTPAPISRSESRKPQPDAAKPPRD